MDVQAAAQASDAFGLSLTQALVAQSAGKNLFISPLSVFLALAMTANGAAPETRKALLRGLHLPDDLTQSNAGCAALLKALTAKETGVDMELAQALWAFNGLRFAPAVQARIQAAFGASLRTVDWQSAAPAINSWATEKTHQLIKRVVEPSDFRPDTTCALSNATYFKGNWTVPFDAKLTRPMPFTLNEGTQRDVPMMASKGDLQHAQTPTFTVVRLPYGTGRFQLYAFLPAVGKTPESLVAELAVFSRPWRSALQTGNIPLYFPKFTLDTPRLELRPTLQKLGVLGSASIGPMMEGGHGGLISKVIHKTRLEVDEEGTRAAAVTVVVGTRGGGPRPIVFNRPFALTLTDEKSQVTLFTGFVNDPSGS